LKTNTLKADNHFALFGLSPRQQLDASALEKAWHAAAVRVHPDRYAHASAAEKRVVMQWAANINEAWQTLRHPLSRARYLCELAGCKPDEAATSDTHFLMQQMTWREQLDEVRNAGNASAQLQALFEEVRQYAQTLQTGVAQLIDEQQDMEQAARRVREWMFVDKLLQEIQASADTTLKDDTPSGLAANL